MTEANHPQYTEADEGLHPTQEHPLSQESVLLHWYDRRQGVGGWHRIGHEPNNEGGKAAIWSFVFHRAGWQYRRCLEIALTPGDRIANGLRAGPTHRFDYADGTARWTIDDGPLRATVHCRNLFPIVDPFPHGDQVASKRFANHFEVAGQVSGEVSYEGRRTAVEGFGYRDHSWGPRDWQNGMPNHRWFTGTLGTELSFAAITAQAPTGNITRVGYVHRAGRIVRASSVDLVAHIEPDGLTHRGGELRLGLAGDELVHVRFRARAGVLFQRGNVVMTEMICDAEGHGLQGYCDAEISSNPRAGKGPVLAALNATMIDGFGPYTPLDLP